LLSSHIIYTIQDLVEYETKFWKNK